MKATVRGALCGRTRCVRRLSLPLRRAAAVWLVGLGVAGITVADRLPADGWQLGFAVVQLGSVLAYLAGVVWGSVRVSQAWCGCPRCTQAVLRHGADARTAARLLHRWGHRHGVAGGWRTRSAGPAVLTRWCGPRAYPWAAVACPEELAPGTREVVWAGWLLATWEAAHGTPAPATAWQHAVLTRAAVIAGATLEVCPAASAAELALIRGPLAGLPLAEAGRVAAASVR